MLDPKKNKMAKTRDQLSEAGYLFAGKATCRGCGASIEWWISPKKKRMPFDTLAGGMLDIHWVTCPQAQEFKKPRMGGKSGERKPKKT